MSKELLERKVTSAYDYIPVGTAHETKTGNIIVTLGEDCDLLGEQLLIKKPKSEAVLFHYKKLTNKVYDTLAVDTMILARPELLAQHKAEIQKEQATAKAEPKIVKSLEDYAEIYKDYIAQHSELKGRKLLKAHRDEILAAKANNPEMDYSQTLANIETAMNIVLKADAEQAQDAKKKTSKKTSKKKTSRKEAK